MKRLFEQEEELKNLLTSLNSDFGEIYYFENISSTMDMAFNFEKTELKNNTLVISDVQTHGRGRFGRPWISDSGDLQFSLLLTEYDFKIPYSMLAAYAVFLSFKKYTERVRLKWVNDVLWDNNRKIAGVLTEERDNKTVIGIGANLNSGEKPEGIRDIATSFYMETGKMIGKELFLYDILSELFPALNKAHKGEIEEVLCAWEKASGICGRHIKVEIESGINTGIVDGIDRITGALLLRIGNRMVEIYDGSVDYLD
jgi:BirA family biotin operon repressor/biotin-[acetyl-CoA-carboxylase] ligase